MSLLHIKYSTLQNLRIFNIRSFRYLDKEKVCIVGYFCAMLLNIFISAHISWCWRLDAIGPIFIAIAVGALMLLSNSMSNSIFSRKDMLLPMLICIILHAYLGIIHQRNIFGYIVIFADIFIFLSLFRLDPKYFTRLADCISKTLAILLLASMIVYILYLLGYNLPSRNASWEDRYYYTDYYLFLLDERFMSNLFPRFHSIFLEPGHMGTIIVLILACQIGKWNRWNNIILIFAMVISFSLAAYGLFVILWFIRLWILRRRMLPSIIVSVAIISTIVIGSFAYKQGDNMLNQYIILRFALNDAGDDIEGNNRVSENFERAYDSFLHSSNVLFGNGRWEEEGGNAGIKLYIYENGFIGFILIWLFYIFSTSAAKDKRAKLSMLAFAMINFFIRAYPLWLAFFVPYYLMAYQEIGLSQSPIEVKTKDNVL